MGTTQQVQATEQQALDALDALRVQLAEVGDAIHDQMHTLEAHLTERLGAVSPDFSKVLERTRAIADAVKRFVPDPDASTASVDATPGEPQPPIAPVAFTPVLEPDPEPEPVDEDPETETDDL